MRKNLSKYEEYPVVKNDSLGRRIYVDWNGAERSIYKYWNDTKSIKIKYRLYHDDASFDAYDKNGKNVISYSCGVLEMKLPKLWTDSCGELCFCAEKNRIVKWKKISTKHT